MCPAMLRVIIIFCVFSQASFEKQRFQDRVYNIRKSRSNEDPVTIETVNNKTSEGAGNITAIDNTHPKPTERYEEMKVDDTNKDNNNVTTNTNTTDCEEFWGTRSKEKEEHLSPKQNDGYVKAKSKCLRLDEVDNPAGMNIQPINGIQSEQQPNTMRKMFTPYTADKEFIIDNEDVRTDSRNTYIGWPYSYNGPYEYQNKNVNTKNEKAKDKRFLGVYTTITPKGKKVIENIPGEYISNAASSNDPIIDNPIYGDQPFFSFVLNDYFDKHHEEDPLIFKDFPWGEEFDNGLYPHDNDDNERRSKRLHESSKPNELRNMGTSQMYKNTADKESVTEKSYDSSREYGKYGKGIGNKDHQELNHDYKGQRETAFKDFADSFANKFGSEESNKKSKYMLKTNQDKGQKRKGFKRVYHKDEYQEDNEFYDNINKNAESEESGGSSFNTGGSQSFLQSKAVGATGNEADSLARRGNKEDKIYKNLYEGNEKNKERDNKMNHYINIAKDAALSNNADYVDNFRI